MGQVQYTPRGISSGIIQRMASKKKSDAAALALKVRENRLRRAAKRQGLELVKARQRDARGTVHGTYGLTDENDWIYLANRQEGYGLTLDQIEAFLNTPVSRRTNHVH
jgi:hypothetical protein